MLARLSPEVWSNESFLGELTGNLHDVYGRITVNLKRPPSSAIHSRSDPCRFVHLFSILLFVSGEFYCPNARTKTTRQFVEPRFVPARRNDTARPHGKRNYNARITEVPRGTTNQHALTRLQVDRQKTTVRVPAQKASQASDTLRFIQVPGADRITPDSDNRRGRLQRPNLGSEPF